MQLFHIHVNGSHDDLYFPGSEFEVGNSANKLFSGYLDRSSTYVAYTDVVDGVVHEHRRNLMELLDVERVAKMTPQEKINLVNMMRGYVYNCNLDFRETILEEVRYKIFSSRPSRQRCMWLTGEESLDTWKGFLTTGGKEISVFEVETSEDGNLFESCDSLLPHGYCQHDDIYRQALEYWDPDPKVLANAKDKEILYTGRIKILKRVQ